MAEWVVNGCKKVEFYVGFQSRSAPADIAVRTKPMGLIASVSKLSAMYFNLLSA